MFFFKLFSFFCLVLTSSISATKKTVLTNSLLSSDSDLFSNLQLHYLKAQLLSQSFFSEHFLQMECHHVLLFQKFPLIFLTQVFPLHSLVLHLLFFHPKFFLLSHLMLHSSDVYSNSSFIKPITFFFFR